MVGDGVGDGDGAQRRLRSSTSRLTSASSASRGSNRSVETQASHPRLLMSERKTNHNPNIKMKIAFRLKMFSIYILIEKQNIETNTWKTSELRKQTKIPDMSIKQWCIHNTNERGSNLDTDTM